MNEPVSIQLVGDGEGNVLVFINGKPYSSGYLCEYDLHDGLKELLKSELVKYQSNNKEELPF